ncbi:thiol:disulfide interchange protein DsbA/DsbL [Moraxella sp. FZLJ2107]|uniref:thiol:disulfide interchange protein DsbA/DsbL n=1 Tax=unclassified Moraxella TaxID=2685852 RepID=UPI00209C28C2|nr:MULTISPECIES: thiol:disulfide interchange protein DsbA/DsbL [unclassified Moraxella]USZ15753.1 thiol:disulfide interchange protein DsbA/DsbL [Moraxella sp. FZFQ2102]UTO04448.1 thiol:disulfide interchange protein DsbA/DsbL [Moraxella sp. FZLJ2107]UTO23281.1 thiol:disulfide interchange protein DsbA/DsbL [Moraxella sp. FZLJ2109]
MKFALKTTLLATAVGLATLSHANFVEGKDYQVLSNPENIAGDVIVVREFFWYGCPHCYNLEPHMQKWAKTRAKDVAFFQTPAAMNSQWEVAARGFYAAQQLGAQEKTHQALFDTVHKEGKRQVIGTQDNLANWYASQGVDKAKFNSLYNSFAVTTKIERAKAGAMRYQLTGVPAVVVQGKYVVSGEDAKVPQVVDFLVNKVREEKK